MNYILENQELKVEFSTKGGTLTSIKDQEGIEYLWQGDATYWSGQAPVLFPICGSIREDQAKTLDGKEMSMPRHGIVRKEEFQLEYAEKDKISFSITSNEAMLTKFPYSFKLYSDFYLQGNEIHVTYRIENTGTETMPFFIGGHPGFNCPIFEGDSYSDYQIVFEEKETCTVPRPVTETGLIDIDVREKLLQDDDILQLGHELFHKDAIILDQIKSRKVSLLHKERKNGVELEFRSFPYLILWSSQNDGPFIAIEPWSGLSTCNDEDDIFEHKRNVQFVEAGKIESYTYTIRIL